MHDDRLTQTQKDVGGLSYSRWICTCRSVCGTWLNSSVYMTSANTNTQTHTCAQKPEGANSQKYTYAHTYISHMFLWRKKKTSLHPCFHRDVFLHVGKWCLWPMEPALLSHSDWGLLTLECLLCWWGRFSPDLYIYTSGRRWWKHSFFIAFMNWHYCCLNVTSKEYLCVPKMPLRPVRCFAQVPLSLDKVQQW